MNSKNMQDYKRYMLVKLVSTVFVLGKKTLTLLAYSVRVFYEKIFRQE